MMTVFRFGMFAVVIAGVCSTARTSANHAFNVHQQHFERHSGYWTSRHLSLEHFGQRSHRRGLPHDGDSHHDAHVPE